MAPGSHAGSSMLSRVVQHSLLCCTAESHSDMVRCSDDGGGVDCVLQQLPGRSVALTIPALQPLARRLVLFVSLTHSCPGMLLHVLHRAGSIQTAGKIISGGNLRVAKSSGLFRLQLNTVTRANGTTSASSLTLGGLAVAKSLLVVPELKARSLVLGGKLHHTLGMLNVIGASTMSNASTVSGVVSHTGSSGSTFSLLADAPLRCTCNTIADYSATSSHTRTPTVISIVNACNIPADALTVAASMPP